MSKTRKAVIYARYSSDNQREESIEAQVYAINEFAEKNDYFILKTYKDEGISGTTDRRPAFQEMIADSKSGLFDVVLVHKLDRFARDRADSVIYKKQLKSNGVEVISVAESFINGNPFGVVMEGMLEGWAQYYSENLSREVRKGQDANVRKYDSLGKVKHNGGKPPFGYDIDPNGFYVINADEAIAVKKVFDMYISDYPYAAVQEWLRNNGYKTKYGNDFGKSTLKAMLSNEKYRGVYTYRTKKRVMVNGKYKDIDNPNKVRIENGIPAIIDDITFMKAQSIMKKKDKTGRPGSNKRKYLLTPYLVCGECGSSIQGNSYTGGRGKKHTYIEYKCQGKRSKQCSSKTHDKAELENAVFTAIEQEYFTKDKIEVLTDKIYAAYLEANERRTLSITMLEKKIRSLKSDIDSLVIAITKMPESNSLYLKLSDHEATLKLTENELINERIRLGATLDKETIVEHLSLGKDLPNRSQKEKALVLRTFVDKIVLHGQQIEVFFKADMENSYGDEGN